MVIASLLQRAGLVVLQMQNMNGRVHGWRRSDAGRPRTWGITSPRRRIEPVAAGSFWDSDAGEPTWEDAEWQ